MIEIINGPGTIEKRIPAMLRMYLKYGIDMRTTPILVYPTLHYQNGGLKISADGMTDIENLFVAGEAVGGIHGRNRLMGNSLLDIIVFGRNAGRNASATVSYTHLAAAVKVIGLLAKDKLVTNPCTAGADELLCNGCSSCEKVCP